MEADVAGLPRGCERNAEVSKDAHFSRILVLPVAKKEIASNIFSISFMCLSYLPLTAKRHSIIFKYDEVILIF